MLKPKNAVAIVGELIPNLTYDVEEVPNRPDGRTFRASVMHDDIVHEGFGTLKHKMFTVILWITFSGFSQDQAKNGAAEVVLKHYIKSNNMNEPPKKSDDDAADKMDTGTDDDNANVPIPWQHVASFAIYKLFSQWEEDPNLIGVSINNSFNLSCY